MSTYMIWNGNIVAANEKTVVSIDDRGYQFGDGVYEVIRIYGGKLHLLSYHLQRLFRSLHELRITAPFTEDELVDQLLRIIEKNDFTSDGIVYIQVTRGLQERDHIFAANLKAVYYIKLIPFPRNEKLLAEGVNVLIQEDIRWLRCDIKSLNLLPNIMARNEAHRQGFFEALFVRDNVVTECGSANFFLVKNGVLVTHPANHFILNGITRIKVMELAKKLQIPIEERKIYKEELHEAEECFLTATPLEVLPIVNIDHKPVANGAVGNLTRTLQQEYAQSIQKDLYFS